MSTEYRFGRTVAASLGCLGVVVLGLLTAAEAAVPVPLVKPLCRADAGLITVSAAASLDEPLIVLFERYPWLPLESEFPSAVVYEDGRVLLSVDKKQKAKVVMGHIDSRAAVSLRDRMVADGFMGAAANTKCASISDSVTVEILVRRGDSWKMASAYAIGRGGECEVQPPKGFTEAYVRLQKLRLPGAKRFEPDEMELSIWAFENAEGKPMPWPADVPAPPANVVPRDHPDGPRSYHHVVSARFRPQIDKLVRARDVSKPSRATLLNGRKWTVVPRPLWPGYQPVEDVVRCAYEKGAIREPRDDE